MVRRPRLRLRRRKAPTRRLRFRGSVIIAAGNRPPTREEVAEAISEMSDASGAALGINNSLKTQIPIVIVEEFKVERVDIKRDHGSARLEVDSKALIDAGEIKHKERHEKVRWELRRTDPGGKPSHQKIERTFRTTSR